MRSKKPAREDWLISDMIVDHEPARASRDAGF
jgi:hypothetical protein